MAKHRNHVIHDNNQDTLERLAEEYAMLGRDVKLEQGKLTVLALPRKRRGKREKR